jgi:hypothetical protein
MGTKVAVLDFEYSLSGVSEVTPKSAVIAPSPSSKTKITGKGVYRGTITLTFAPGTLSAAAFTSSGTNTLPAVFTINPAMITKLKVDGQTALGENDVSASIMVTGLKVSGEGSATVTVPATVKISSAGQNILSAV